MRETLEVEFQGKTYKASYSVDKRMVTVWAATLSKSTQVGGSPPETIARIIAKELLMEAEQQGLL
ncbi:hypothetical protein AB1J88_03060 [Pseudomonas sp. S8]|uniref:hypothetical protein n=1 Tax=Pseudomonas sp. S8 TaxID=211136 RepID=UPI003D28B71A